MSVAFKPGGGECKGEGGHMGESADVDVADDRTSALILETQVLVTPGGR